MNNETKIILITGPTASGKSLLAFDLAQALGCPLVSTDSVQLYRGFDIGSDKAPDWMRGRVQHIGLDLTDASRPLSAGAYARAVEAEMVASGSPVFVACGGSGLYQQALLYGLDELPQTTDEIRRRVREQFGGDPKEWHRALQQLSPLDARGINPNDHYRCERALSIYLMTGKGLREQGLGFRKRQARWPLIKIAIEVPRDLLYARINARIDQMIARGLLDECRALLDRGYREDLEPMRSIGYRFFLKCVQGSVTLQEALDRTKQESRRYAKRQLTWFRKETDIQWLAEQDRRKKFQRAHALGAYFLERSDRETPFLSTQSAFV